jgi:hypothetical protein
LQFDGGIGEKAQPMPATPVQWNRVAFPAVYAKIIEKNSIEPL